MKMVLRLEQDIIAAKFYIKKLNLTATARISIGVYNTKEDIDIFCKAIENCRKIFDLKQ